MRMLWGEDILHRLPWAAVSPGSHGSDGHYFDEDPAARSRPREVDLVLPDVAARLRTDSGVFSGTRLDPGTRVLLVQMAAKRPDARQWPAGDLVDLGCGYGPIAIALALRHPGRRVWAVDTNRRALELTAANAEGAGVGSRVIAVPPEEFPAGERVAAVVSNPPIRIGKDELHALLELWLSRLAPGGESWLVVQRHLGADSLARWLRSIGWETTRVASRQGYRVLVVRAVEPDRP